MDDEQIDTVTISTAPQEVPMQPSKDANLVTALTCHRSGDVFFVGKEDGTVWVYDTKTGGRKQKLISHAEGVAISSLLFDEESQILSSTDSSSRLLSHKLVSKSIAWEVIEARFDYRAGVTIDYLLSNIGHTRLLVSSPNVDMLCAFMPDGAAVERELSWGSRGPVRWGCHPSNQDQLMLIVGNALHIYEWKDLKKLNGPDGIILDSPFIHNLIIRSMKPCVNNTVVATNFTESVGRSVCDRSCCFGVAQT